MRFASYKFQVLSDLYRLGGSVSALELCRKLIVGASFKYIFWLRTTRYCRNNSLFRYLIYPFARIMLHRYEFKYGISIPFATDIGNGLTIGHFGGIVVNERVRIGNNCNISHGVTLGKTNRGNRNGYPQIGDNVYIGPGAKIIGGIRIGNNVAIGANCVVTRDVPDNSVVIGIPGRVISQDGSVGYINFVDYEDKIR